MSARSHRNKRWVRRGKMSRVSRSQNSRDAVGILLPCLAMHPAGGPVDETTLTTEVARLAEVGRRRGCVG